LIAYAALIDDQADLLRFNELVELYQDDMIRIAKAVGLKPSELLAELDDNIYVDDFSWNVVNTPGYAELIEKQGYKTIKVEEQGFPAYGFREPSQFKSSDPVTYADDGSVIPLSERFDTNNDDISYSLPTQDSDGNILTDGQMEYFKNSQARDSEGKMQVVYHTTNNGGFTVFDPSYSDDKRSLFFASNFDVSQTYGRHAENPIDLKRDAENGPYKDILDFVYLHSLGWQEFVAKYDIHVYKKGTDSEAEFGYGKGFEFSNFADWVKESKRDNMMISMKCHLMGSV
jgi:hypothetical protein